MPAPYQIEIEKVYNGEYWVNSYYSDAASLAEAVTLSTSLVAAERAVHGGAVTFTKAMVRTTAEGDDQYVNVPINANGQAALGGTMVPLFVVVRVDFGAAIGRPSRKFLRGCLGKDEVTVNGIVPEALARIGTNYVSPLVTLPGYCDIDGDALLNGAAFPQATNRQLRRGSKKKNILSTPTPV